MILKTYINLFEHQDSIYPTTIDFINILQNELLIDYQYLIKDLIETITIYDNQITAIKHLETSDETYSVQVGFNFKKTQNDEQIDFDEELEIGLKK